METLDKKAALTLYAKGYSVKRLAAHFGCRTTPITQLLAEAGVELHPGGKPKLNPEQSLSVAQRYAAGESMKSLARDFRVSYPTIRYAVRLHGAGQQRPPGAPKFWTPERIAEVLDRQERGESLREIAASMGVKTQAVAMALRHAGHGVPPAPKRTGADHHAWKGGRVEAGGYWLVRPEQDDVERGYARTTSMYVRENRLLMARMLGRPLAASRATPPW